MQRLQPPERAEIEAAHIAGATLRDIGKRFNRSKTTIEKHIKLHVPAAGHKAREAANDREVEAGDAILAEIDRLKSEPRRLQDHAEKKKDYRAALTAVRELTRLVELSARLMGELRDREISVGFINIDPDTAERMARMFLARRAAGTSTTGSPIVSLWLCWEQTPLNEIGSPGQSVADALLSPDNVTLPQTLNSVPVTHEHRRSNSGDSRPCGASSHNLLFVSDRYERFPPFGRRYKVDEGLVLA